MRDAAHEGQSRLPGDSVPYRYLIPGTYTLYARFGAHHERSARRDECAPVMPYKVPVLGTG
jgi:hypothetical protein